MSIRSICIAGLLLAAPSLAAASTTITLDTSVLPSAQGWTYYALGDGAGIPETQLFSNIGGVLHQDTTSRATTSGGSNLYVLPVAFSPADTFIFSTRLRITEYGPGYVNGDNPYAVSIGFLSGQYAYQLGLAGPTPSDTTTAGVTSFSFPAGFDSTQYHNYVLTGADGLATLKIDGQTIFSNVAFEPYGDDPAIAQSPPYIYLGDATGTEDAIADYASLSFSVTGAPEPAAWTLMVLGVAGLGAALRRRRLAGLAV